MGKLKPSLAVVLGLVCGVSAAELPYDCELECLTVAKGVHFDTGVQVTSAPTAQVKFAFQDGTTMDVFGTTEAVDGCFILNHESSHLYYRYGTSANAGKSSNAVQPNVIYDFVCAQDILSDGATFYTNSKVPVWSTSTQVSIPGRRYPGPLAIYAFRLDMGGETVRDYVPVQKGATVGLYDKVSGEFLAPAGGTATAGAVKGNTAVSLDYGADAVNETDYADTTLTVTVAEGARVTLAGKLTGATRLVKKGAGTLVVTGAANDFLGGVELRGGILNTTAAQGYGTGGIVIDPDSGVKYSLQFEVPGARFANPILARKAVHWDAFGYYAKHIQFLADTTYDGEIRSACNDAQFIVGVTNKVAVTLNGDVTCDTSSLFGFFAYGDVVFNGRFECNKSSAVGAWSTEGTITFNNPSNRIAYAGESSRTSGDFGTYAPTIRCGADNVISNLLWAPNYRFTSATCNRIDLNGHDQVIRGMKCVNANFGDYYTPGFQRVDELPTDTLRANAVYYDRIGALQYASASPATLTLTGTGPDTKLVSPAALTGALSLVFDADDTHETIFSNRTHTMSGSIRVKRGTLTGNMGTSFSRAEGVKVDAGATFRVDTVATNAFANAKRLEIDGTFALASAAPQDFNHPDVVLGDDAVLAIPSGAYCVRSLTVGGVTYTEGTFGTGGTALPQLPADVTFRVIDQRWPVVLAEPVYVIEVAADTTNRLDEMSVDVTQGGQTETVAFSSLANPVSGTIVKRGAGVVVSSRKLAGFAGDVLVEAGGFAVDDNLEVGPQTTGVTTVWVRDGASFIVQGTKDTCGASNLKLYNNFHLKGTGLNGLGAIDMEIDASQNYAFSYGTWTLDGDALISGRTTSRVDLGHPSIDLNGYTFTRSYAGSSAFQYVWSYVNVLSPGRLAVAPGASFLIQATCAFCMEGETEIAVAPGATLGYWNSTHSQMKQTKIVFEPGAKVCNWSNGGATEEKCRMLPGDVRQGWWDGPVQVDGRVRVYGSCDYKGLAFRGKVSGSGDLLLSSGWMHFYSPENDFDGAIAFTDPTSTSYASFAKGIAVYTNGALPVVCRSVAVTNAPLMLMNATAFDLPAMEYCVKDDLEYALSGGTGGTLAGLRKTGDGVLELSAPLAVTGRLEVAAGTLKVTGDGGCLTAGTYAPGAGVLDGDLAITGHIEPGGTAGRVTGRVTVGAGVTLAPGVTSPRRRTSVLSADGGVQMFEPILLDEDSNLYLMTDGETLYTKRMNGMAIIVR